MFVCCDCCMLSRRGLCDELITRPEESYRLWCVVMCDLENLKNEEAMTRGGSQRQSKYIYIYIYIYINCLMLKIKRFLINITHLISFLLVSIVAV